ncbi:MAG: carbohydrate ABC transporter permease [Clostridia bacterium]|jgi:multiple sugar transport system permease protein|nr:carbohydrate ABC transporter permease [Clostridia bacterium]
MTDTQSALLAGAPLSEIPPARKPGKGERAQKIGKRSAFYLGALLLACFFLFPFFVMICISLLSDADVYLQVLFSPEGIVEIGNYLAILTPGADYMRYVANSLMVSAICAVGIPLVSSLCAFGFSKLHFHGRDVMFSVVLGTLMIPSVVTMLPLYAIYVKLGWVDTLFPLWVPSLFGGGATNIFLMRQFFRGIPDDVIAAAKIDGAGTFRLYWQFCLPLCIPVMLYVGYMSFVGAWNNFAGPMMYLGKNSQWMTLALGLYYDFGPPSGSLSNAAMAAGAVMTLPCIVLFIFFQKYLIEGVSVTGLKG